MKKRLWSIALALVMCLSLLPAAALAEEPEGEGGTTEAAPFEFINISGTGTIQDSDFLVGAYQSILSQIENPQENKEAQKASVQIKAVRLKNNGGTPEGELTYYYVADDSPSVHEIRLYGYTEIEPTRLGVSGTDLSGTIEKHVYGDGDNTVGRFGGALYWYTIPVTFPASGESFDLTLDRTPFLTISVVHMSDTAPLALVSTIWVKDYEDGDGDVPNSVTLEILGASLPNEASEYLCEGTISDSSARVMIPAQTVKGPDTYGYRMVTFDLSRYNLQNTSSNSIKFAGGTYPDENGEHEVENYDAFFFDPRSHLKQEKDGEGNIIGYLPEFKHDLDKVEITDGKYKYWHLGGTYALFSLFYSCIYKDPTSSPNPPAHMHDWSSWTSLNDAQHRRSCSCGETQKADHTLGDWTVTDPTTTQTGLKERSCTECGYKQTEVIPKLPQEVTEDSGNIKKDDAAGTTTVTVNTPNVEAVEVPVAAIDNNTALNVKLPDVEAEFDQDASKHILDNAGSDEGTKLEIRLEEKKETDLSDGHKAAANELPNNATNPKFLNFDILAKKEGQKPTSVFTSGNTAGFVRLTVKYEHASNSVKCYWLKDDGNKEEVAIESFDPAAGTVTLKLNHFSVYVLATIPPTPVTPVTPPSSPSDGGGGSSGGGGGGGSSTPSYSASVNSGKNGSASISPKSAQKGDTVTITVKPDSGYELDTLTVTDSKGNKLALTDKGDGKFTFTMPSSKVTVSADFAEMQSAPAFADIPANAWYAEAVQWAARLGITGGVGNDRFGPDLPCTRSQIVTFLWRAAGSPEPKGAAGMSDVDENSFYAKAVAWAIENGVTTGVGGGLFSPDDPCTRAQAVTFLARALGAKAEGGAAFSDVPANAWYAEAVAWAAANGITTGIGGGLFGSGDNCARAQIVTFLWRSYSK